MTAIGFNEPLYIPYKDSVAAFFRVGNFVRPSDLHMPE